MGNLESKKNMVFFRGKITVSPNTLNNEIHTYFFAHYWQQKHTQEQFQRHIEDLQRNTLNLQSSNKELNPPKEFQYTYEKWMKLIIDVAEFNRFYCQCYEKAYNKGQKDYVPINIMDFRAFRLFHDWDVWGDSTSYPELKVTASFDAFNAKPFSCLEKDLYMTTKLGTNKCVIANQDTDNQDMSKLFALTMNMNDQLKLQINPSVSRELHYRTVDTLPWTPSMGVHWFANGLIRPVHGNIKRKDIVSPFNSLLPSYKTETWAEMRMIQYRYNHPTKMSSVVGYVMSTEDNEDGNSSYSNKNWRIVPCKANYDNPNPAWTYNGNKNNSTDIQIFLRKVSYGSAEYQGILVDLSGAVMDANTKDLLPLLPTKIDLTIKCGDAVFSKPLCHEQIKQCFHKYAGIVLIEDFNRKGLPWGQQISIKLDSTVFSEQFNKEIVVNFRGVENEFDIEIKDRFLKNKEIKLLRGSNCEEQQGMKSQLDEKSTIKTIFEDYITFDVYLTSYGRPFNGDKEITLNSRYNIDKSGLTQYTTNKDYLVRNANQPLTPRERIDNLIRDSPQFAQKYKSFEQVDKDVFQSKLQKEIIPQTDRYVKSLYRQSDASLRYKYPGGQFSLVLDTDNPKQNTKLVQFVKGYAQISVALNERLTEKNNPRHPAMESLCLVGTFSIQEKVEKSPEDKKQPEPKIIAKQDFTTIFFQNPVQDPYESIDWLNVVGPKLKLMGLMYPAMQNIVNLYDYDVLSMNAMKRAFEIEDENHSRYMPATREMSSVTHRQISRWLYNPLYDSKVHLQAYKKKSEGLSSISFPNFTKGKEALIQLLKDAFKIELTTIPLYLSALYSIKDEGQASKLIRSVAKDEMKHLFIVSNLLNAVGDQPPYPLPNQKEACYIPSFPLNTEKELICFHFQKVANERWAKLMGELPIQSSIRDQLLRFIMIEMPAQAYEIQITPFLMSQKKRYEYISLQSCKYSEFYDEPDLQEKLKETISRINDVNDAVRAVSLEESTVGQSIPGEGKFITIGMAYEKIMNYLWALNDISPQTLFNGNNSKQFTYMYLQDMTEIINLRTALEQIRLIVSQGEGSSLFSATGDINRTSHFIKFIEIFTGCDLTIESRYDKVGTLQEKYYKRTAKFIFTPNYQRFPNFPNYTDLKWTAETDKLVDEKVNSELQKERLSDQLKFTKFPNTYAPLSFVNGYIKILEEFGFIFRTDPKSFKSNSGKTFDQARLRCMENTIAKMRQMTLNASHVVRPNDTFDKTGNPSYPSASPKYNISQSSYLPPTVDEK